jgi:protein-tyrosine phosphatase
MIAGRLKRWLGGAPDAGDAQALLDRAECRVLMVCMGNICRSPTAEGVLRAKLAQAGLGERVAVDSAGTHGYHTGEAPDPRAIAAAARRGYDIARLQARPVHVRDFERFHWLLPMDHANRAWLTQRKPAESAAELRLLMGFAGHNPGVEEVPDPYYGGPAGFDKVLDLVEDACDGFVAHLQACWPADGPGLLRPPPR